MKAKTIYVDEIDSSTATTYYTVPPNTRAKVVLLHAQHDTGSGAKDVEIFINDGATNNHVMHAKALSVGDNVNFGVSQTSYLMMETGFTVNALATDTGCQMLLTVEESNYIARTA